VLKLHLVHRLSIDEIGRAHGVHRATAARWLERVRDELQAETRRLLRQRLGLDLAGIDSMVALVESRLEVSFRRLLTDA
jgi:RNA polymerase sigma-70 factor (ECF subfamily)